MADTEEVVEEYRSSLADLIINSKPLISMLTMLAEDHSQYAQHIVQLIEQHLQKVKPSQKLPVLYLIDSIIKNLTDYSYSRLFSKNIVSIFCDTFQKVDERTRGSMYKLRQTWQMYFPNPKLYALDVRVNMMDPAWPIIAEPPEQGNIHVNPRFLVQKEEDEGTLAEQPETLMRKQLIAKQQELLGILQHRMELEVAEPLPKVDAASHKQADYFSKHQDDDVSIVSDPAGANSMKASAIRSLPSMVSSKPALPKTYSPADTNPSIGSISDHSAKIQKPKLPLPKVAPEISISKPNDATDSSSSLISNVNLVPTTTITAVKARDPRLTRDPRLALRDPRNQSLPLNRRVVINETHLAPIDKTFTLNSKPELTSKPPTISPSLLSNMHSLDAVKSHTNTPVVSNPSKNKPNPTGSVANEKSFSDKRLVVQDTINLDNYELPKSNLVTSEQNSNNDSGNKNETNDHAFDVNHLIHPNPAAGTTPKICENNTFPSTGMVTAADFDKPFTPNLEQKNLTEPPDLEIISSTIDMTLDDMSNKTHSDSDDVQFLPNKTCSNFDKGKDKASDRNFSRMRDRRRGSDDSDKGRRRDESDRDRNRYGRDSRSGSSRRDDDRRSSRHREDDYRDRNTDRFGRERRSKDRFTRRKDRYDDDDYDHYRRRRERSPMRNRSPENMNSRGWQQENERKSYKDSKGDSWKSSYDNSDSQLSDSNPNKMARSPISKSLHLNHQLGSVSPKDHQDDKNSSKGLKRDRDYRENSKVPSPQGEHDVATSPKRMCAEQAIESQPDRHLNTKEDLSDLFGKVDQDYRVPPSNLNDQRIPYMRSGSHSGWAKFKADHPDEFFSDDGQGPMDIDERYKDVDMRWNVNNRPGCVGSPMKSFSPRVDISARDKQASFIRGAAKLAQSGKISHEEHQLVLKQIGRLQNMTFESGKITENYQMNSEAEGRDFDHRPIDQNKQTSKWGGLGVSELSNDTNSRSPLHENPGSSNSHSSQDGDMRDLQLSRMTMNMQTPIDHPLHPNDMNWDNGNLMHPENMYDLRWKGNTFLADNEVTGEVVVDHKPYEIIANGKPRKIRLHGKMFEIHADARERAIFVNNALCYRFGEMPKDVQVDGRRHRFHYQGQPKCIWIDQQSYEVRVDAPPRRIILNKEEHSLQIDGRDMMIFIDRIEQGIYGGPPRNIFVKNMCHEIRFDPPPRQILIDGKPCELKLNCKIPFVVIDGKPHGIRFDGPPRDIIIDDNSYRVPVDKPIKIRLGKRPHILAFGGPAHEVIIDGKWFEVRFEGPPVEVNLGNRSHTIMLKGASPNVKILGELPMMINEPNNQPQFGFNGTNMFPPAGAMLNNFNRPRGPENFQPRPPHWDLPFVRRPNHPEPLPMIRPSPFPPDRQLENMRFPGHPALPPGVIGPGPVQPLPGPGLVNHSQAPFYPGLPPNLNAVTLPPMTALPPGITPVNADATSNPPAPVVPPQFQQMTLASAGIASVSCPGMPSIPTAPTALATTASVVPSSASISGPNLAAVAAAAAGRNLLPVIPANVLNKLVRSAPPMLPLSQHQPAPVPVATPAPALAPATPLDVSSLFQKLVDAGIIPTATTDKDKKQPEKEKEPEPEVIPELFDFKIEKLKIRYSRFIEELYEGIQCSSCGIRFTVDDTEKYREHLDWHFRQNKREKDDYKVAKYRKWYYEMPEWIQYEEIQDDEEKNRSNFFENMLNPVQEPTFIGPQGNKVIQCPAATGNDTDDVCDICGDPFEQFWEEDEEEWHLRNAVRVEGKTYHPVCYEDVKESVDASSVDTPREIVENNPLETTLEKPGIILPVTNSASLASNATPASTTTTAGNSSSTDSCTIISTTITTTASSLSALTTPIVSTDVVNSKSEIPVSPEVSTAITAAVSTPIASSSSPAPTSSVAVLPNAINPVLATNLPSSTLSNILAAVTNSEKSNNALTSLLTDSSSQLSPSSSSSNAENQLLGSNNNNNNNISTIAVATAASSSLPPPVSTTAEEFNIEAQPITTIVSSTPTVLKTAGL